MAMLHCMMLARLKDATVAYQGRMRCVAGLMQLVPAYLSSCLRCAWRLFRNAYL